MKKLFKKIISGFTLIEVLSVILILGIIALVAVLAVSAIINNARLNAKKNDFFNYQKEFENYKTLFLLSSSEDDIYVSNIMGEDVKKYVAILKEKDLNKIAIYRNELIYLYDSSNNYDLKVKKVAEEVFDIVLDKNAYQYMVYFDEFEQYKETVESIIPVLVNFIGEDVKSAISSLKNEDIDKVIIFENKLSYIFDSGDTVEKERILTELGYNIIYGKLNPYFVELRKIEKIAYEREKNRIANGGSASAYYIGSALSAVNYVSILGINYWDGWYKITALDLENAGLDSDDFPHVPFIVKYSKGYVQSVPGEIVGGNIIHSLNYTGEDEDQLYLSNLLTAVVVNSTKTISKWGELNIVNGYAIETDAYDSIGGLKLGSQIATIAVDQTKPINQKFSINVTVKGTINQNAETYGATIVAISDTSGNYLLWLRIRNGYLQVLTYTISNQSGLTGNTSGTGYISKQIPSTYDNDYMNIQVVAEKSHKTKVYLNGTKFGEFDSGASNLTYGTLTVGDLRSGRNLKYTGSIYNFALYSDLLDENAISQNWLYTKKQLNIN